MKKLLFIVLAAISFWARADSANDLILTQRKADNSGFTQRNVSPTANGLMYFNGSYIPAPLTLGTGFSISSGTLNFNVGIGSSVEAWSANLDLWSAVTPTSYVLKTTTVNGHALSGNVTVTPSDLGLVIGTNVEAWNTKLDAISALTNSSGWLHNNGSGVFTYSAPSNTDVGLSAVTNDAQTKAAIVPNTVPSAGQIHVGNAGGTAFGVVSIGSDATMDSTGAVTLTNGGSTRSHLGLTIGTNVQAWSAQLDTVASNGSSFYLNASNLNAGTLPDARFPATLPAASGINLTALNASNLGSGTVPDARFPATLPALSGVNLTALNASNLGSGTVPDARFPATLPALSGTNLTSLNASNISSGTLPAGRYSSSTTILTNLGVYPIGTIANSALDSGTWLTMNGQVVSQSTYATLFGIVGHQPEFTWTTSPITSGLINHVCYGNSGTYVAVGAGGVIYTTTDLTTWTSRTSGVATALNAVTWDSTNSLFIAVGASNVILTSPDGTTWTSRTSGVTSTLLNIIFANGEDVAVGSSGWVTYSTNGTSWTATQPNSGPSLQIIWYTKSQWFAAQNNGSANGIVYSTNGTTWNYVSKPTSNNMCPMGFDANNFYVGDASTGEIWSSATGASWSDTGFSVLTPPTALPPFFGSGVISCMGQYPIYTSNGFSTNTPIFFKSSVGRVPSPTCATNPHGNSAQKFTVLTSIDAGTLSTSNNYIWYTVDGIHFNCSLYAIPLGVAGNSARYNYWNGHYFIFYGGTINRFFYAADPYDPSTQFQIPTQFNGAGSNLVIKAL